MSKDQIWHNLSGKDLALDLKSDLKQGLSNTEREKRQKDLGRNVLPEEKASPFYFIVLRQLKNPMIYMLLVVGILSLAFGYFIDAAIMATIVFLNVSLGFIQEERATSILTKLKKVLKYNATILSGGNKKIISAEDLVPGDIIILMPGERVPADARIIESYDLVVNEMTLTGEWLSSRKATNILPIETPLGDRNNLVYMGTTVEAGTAKAIVFTTGMNTEFGKIAGVIGKIKERKTPLQGKISTFTSILSLIISVVAIFIFLEGLITGKPFVDIFMVTIAVVVAAIPESLPAILTIVLAIGMRKILKRQGLVKRLLAAETLGSVDIICTDKTKTLTEGTMVVSEVLTDFEILNQNDENHFFALKAASLAGEAFIENPNEGIKKWIIRGRPTEKALLLAAVSAGVNLESASEGMTKIKDIPFDAGRKYSAKVYKTKEGICRAYIIGSPEIVLEKSAFFKTRDGNNILTSGKKGKINSSFEDMAGRGLRVIAVAYKEFKEKDIDQIFSGLSFVALIGLKDPIRKEAKTAIGLCRKAGIRPIIVTGDHKLTAAAVAKELGLDVKEENIMEGRVLDSMSDDDLAKMINSVQIYARVEPIHKMRIVKMFQEQGLSVAMTGDGVNDAPALKKADIGVALGSATEVAKESADLILLNDSFLIIVHAIEEGRRMMDNLRKVVSYLLMGGFTEVMLVGLGVVFGLPLPILASQILWKNMIESTPPSIALAFEEKEKGIMNRQPENTKAPLLTSEMKVLIFVVGFLTNLILFGIFIWFLNMNMPIDLIRSVMFAGLSIDSFLFVFSCRNLRMNIWHYNPFSNKFVNLSVVIGVLMIFLAIYTPFFQMVLKTTSLGLFEWAVLLFFGILNLFLIELTKLVFIRLRKV